MQGTLGEAQEPFAIMGARGPAAPTLTLQTKTVKGSSLLKRSPVPGLHRFLGLAARGPGSPYPVLHAARPTSGALPLRMYPQGRAHQSCSSLSPPSSKPHPLRTRSPIKPGPACPPEPHPIPTPHQLQTSSPCWRKQTLWTIHPTHSPASCHGLHGSNQIGRQPPLRDSILLSGVAMASLPFCPNG